MLGEGCSIKTSLRPSASAISHRSSVRYLVLLTTRRSHHRTIPEKESPCGESLSTHERGGKAPHLIFVNAATPMKAQAEGPDDVLDTNKLGHLRL